MTIYYENIFFALALVSIYIALSVWAYRDAIRKGNKKEFALIVLFGTLILPFVGLIIYLIIRNDR